MSEDSPIHRLDECEYPVVQQSIHSDHVEIDFPGQKRLVVLDESIARHVAERILEIIDG